MGVCLVAVPDAHWICVGIRLVSENCAGVVYVDKEDLMYIPKLLHLMAIVPIAALLTASFFVLFTIRKIEEKGLRGFGYVVAGFLWLAALIVFAGAAFGLGKNFPGMNKCAKMRSETRMGGMPYMGQQVNLIPTAMPVTGQVTKEVKISGCSKCQSNKGVVTKTK